MSDYDYKDWDDHPTMYFVRLEYQAMQKHIKKLEAQLAKYESAWQEGIRYEQFKAVEDKP